MTSYDQSCPISSSRLVTNDLNVTLFAWNTGRSYGAQGQRIAAAIVKDGRAAFVDVDRGINGLTLKHFKHDTCDGAEVRNFVMRAYDSCNYVDGVDTKITDGFGVRLVLEELARSHVRDPELERLTDEASEVLSRLVEQARLEPDVQSDYEARLHLEELKRALETRLSDRTVFPNPVYNARAELAARLITLYDNYPDDYSSLFLGIAMDFADTCPDTLDGLVTLNSVLRSLDDDHSYVFDPEAMQIAFDGRSIADRKLLSPAALLQIVKDIESNCRHTPSAP